MKSFGIAVFIIWASLLYTLYPLPTKQISMYENYLYEETETYIETLSEIDRAEYFNDKNAFLKSKVEEGKFEIWIVWTLKLFFIVLGLLAGYLAYVGRVSRLIITVTSFAYLYAWIVKLIKMLPVIDPSWLNAYIQLLLDGVTIGKHSLIYQLFFYHQFLIMPILHIALLVFCVFWRNLPDNRFSAAKESIS